MPKCKKCGTDFAEFEEECPYCATVTSADTISDIMDEYHVGSDKKKKEKKERKSLFRMGSGKGRHKEGCNCGKCGALMNENDEICPKCGFSPSVETITSIMDKKKGE
ncbi:MAG: hypothetical protein JW738_02655 [Actinobacteria bacterium]|nr:hypothetical protein [Actinomycetota bacterium]